MNVMAEPNYVLRWAHLGLGRNPRYRDLLAKQGRIAHEMIEEFYAEQQRKNAAMRVSGQPLRLAPRYANGRKI